MYELISECSFDEPYELSCDIVSTKAGFEAALARWSQSSEISYLCIAGHGNRRGVILDDGKIGTAKAITKALAASFTKTHLVGLHLSSCGTVNSDFSGELLKGAPPLHWISGYSTTADWVKSLAMDMLFFRLLLDSYKDESPEELIRRVAESLLASAPGLCESLGMRIFERRPEGKMLDLLGST